MKLRIGKPSGLLAAAAILASALVPVAPQPALAAQTQICGGGGSGYCINDWGNGLNNNPVKMYYGGSSNEDFVTKQINPCNSTPAGLVTETCPFTLGSGYNSTLAGNPIFEVKYGTTGYCVGTTGSQAGGPTAILTGCPDASGNNGGNGTIWVVWSGSSAITRYWANTFYQDDGVPCCGNPPYVTSGGNPGQPLFMADQLGFTDWGGPGWNV